MIENCGRCKYLFGETNLGLTVYGCKHRKWRAKDRPIVPQESKRDVERGAQSATFHRVPEWCPLPDSVAHKQSEVEVGS